jgi:carotenoid cleavage dioxygenase
LTEGRRPTARRPRDSCPLLTGFFAPVTEEVDIIDLDVQGHPPHDLDGLYLRNGPNPRFSPIGSCLHPLDGDSMLHGVWISQGEARYRNRFARTPAVLAEEKVGRALQGGLESTIMPGPADKETFGGAVPSDITTYPKIDPLTGDMTVFCYGLEPPWLT